MASLCRDVKLSYITNVDVELRALQYQRAVPPRFTYTVVFPKEGQMRVAEQAQRSNKLAILWAVDNKNKVFFGPRGVPTKARVTPHLAFLWE
jgi:hypothetical protein